MGPLARPISTVELLVCEARARPAREPDLPDDHARHAAAVEAAAARRSADERVVRARIVDAVVPLPEVVDGAAVAPPFLISRLK